MPWFPRDRTLSGPPQHPQRARFVSRNFDGSPSGGRPKERPSVLVRFQTRTSTLFESFISPIAVGGDDPEEIARTVALRVERGTGTSGRTPGFMHDEYANLKSQGIHLKPEMWPNDFRTQTGQNINVAVNGIAKLIGMIVEDDDD